MASTGHPQAQVIKLDGGSRESAPGANDGASVPILAGQKTMASSLPVTLASDQPAVPVGASLRTDQMLSGSTALTPKFAKIAASASGNNTIVAAVSGKKIRVLALKLIGSDAVNAKWQSGAGGTDLTGLSYLIASSGEVLPFNPAGWFETAAGALLNLSLSAAVAVGGHLTYVEV
ncbi:MAG: hypothetical protein E6Q98_15965 [Rhodospirillaceae bacterium]|nr:MAG: hypothetical protein E6Q98_15965 [Rhodospirillaceae bacterium]